MGDSYGSTWDFLEYLGYGGQSSYEALLEKSPIGVAGVATSKFHEYDVFLSHRGPVGTFVSQLYSALMLHGVRPYADVKDLFAGMSPLEQINKALKGACVHVAIFSKGYANSQYCLDELCEMLKSEQRIIPVFYDVKRSDLQRIADGPYEEAFMKHEKHGRDKISTWKEALRKVVDYKGFTMDEVDG